MSDMGSYSAQVIQILTCRRKGMVRSTSIVFNYPLLNTYIIITFFHQVTEARRQKCWVFIGFRVKMPPVLLVYVY